MNERNEDLHDSRLGLGLRELDGIETPPDITDRVLAGTRSRLATRSRATHSLAALLVVALGLATAIGVWLSNRNEAENHDHKQAAPQDETLRPQLPPPVAVRTPLDIVQLPVSTAHVRGEGLTSQDIKALQRVSGLRGLNLRGHLDAKHIEALARLDKLEQIVFEYELDAKHVGTLQKLASLPRLICLSLAMAEVDDGTLASLQKMKRLRSLELRGELVCTAKGMAAFAKAMPGLRAFGVITMRDSGGVLGQPRTPKGVWAAIPSGLVELFAWSQSIRTSDLRRLPGLKSLDVRGSFGVDRELLKFAGSWRNATVKTPGGFPFRVDAKGKCMPTPNRVVLIQRRGNGAYGPSAYSFRHASNDVMRHANNVDLLFNGCGNLHVNAHGGSANRVLAMGKVESAPTVDKLPKAGWLSESFRPVAGHRYVMEIASKSRQDTPWHVQFRIEKAEGNRVWLEWQHLDLAQMWNVAPLRAGARAGTMGQCGAHGPR